MTRVEDQAGCFGSLFRRRKRDNLTFAPTGDLPKAAVQTQFEPDLKQHQCRFSNYPCNFSYSEQADSWSIHENPPAYAHLADPSLTPDFLKTIDSKLDELDPQLRHLSLQIHSHPELCFQERYAHDHLTAFMSVHGFRVTKHYLGLDTAWRAEYTHGKGGRVLGVNSEMDALPVSSNVNPKGHNLIAIGGCGIAIALKAALEAHDLPGTVVLLGTPAEEVAAGGKILLLERGGYKGIDVCLMSHPSPGPVDSASIGTSIACQAIEVEFLGHSAHAGANPWDGTNALDAAFLAYSGISVLRQQTRPDHRIHGTIRGNDDWAPNIIPDYAKMEWLARAPQTKELLPFVERVKACFEAAGLATSCKVNIKMHKPYLDLNQNDVLAEEFADVLKCHYGYTVTAASTSASTDFGNITYEMPALHPSYAIPTVPQGGNHTAEFTKAAASPEAHAAAMVVTRGLAYTGYRVLQDDGFFKRVKGAFETGNASKK